MCIAGVRLKAGDAHHAAPALECAGSHPQHMLCVHTQLCGCGTDRCVEDCFVQYLFGVGGSGGFCMDTHVLPITTLQ